MNTLINGKNIWVLGLLVLLSACQQNPIKRELANELGVINIGERFIAAYNAHDHNQMLKLVHPEISYMYIDGNQLYTETDSKTSLAEFLLLYFKSTPNAQSILLSSQQQGPFIHQVEQAIWQDENGKPQSQCSLSVY